MQTSHYELKSNNAVGRGGRKTRGMYCLAIIKFWNQSKSHSEAQRRTCRTKAIARHCPAPIQSNLLSASRLTICESHSMYICTVSACTAQVSRFNLFGFVIEPTPNIPHFAVHAPGICFASSPQFAPWVSDTGHLSAPPTIGHVFL